jgi:hypothetical protein
MRNLIRQTLSEMPIKRYTSNIPDKYYPSKKGYKAYAHRQYERLPIDVNIVFDFISDDDFTFSTGTKIKTVRGTDRGGTELDLRNPNTQILPGGEMIPSNVGHGGIGRNILRPISSPEGQRFSEYLFSQTGEYPEPDDFNILRLASSSDFGPVNFDASAYMVFHEFFDSGIFEEYSYELKKKFLEYVREIAPTIGEDFIFNYGHGDDEYESIEDRLLDHDLRSVMETVDEMNPWVKNTIIKKTIAPRVRTVRNERYNSLEEVFNEACAVSLLRQTDTLTDFNPANDPVVAEKLQEMHAIMSNIPRLVDQLKGKIYISESQ